MSLQKPWVDVKTSKISKIESENIKRLSLQRAIDSGDIDMATILKRMMGDKSVLDTKGFDKLQSKIEESDLTNLVTIDRKLRQEIGTLPLSQRANTDISNMTTSQKQLLLTSLAPLSEQFKRIALVNSIPSTDIPKIINSAVLQLVNTISTSSTNVINSSNLGTNTLITASNTIANNATSNILNSNAIATNALLSALNNLNMSLTIPSTVTAPSVPASSSAPSSSSSSSSSSSGPTVPLLPIVPSVPLLPVPPISSNPIQIVQSSSSLKPFNTLVQAPNIENTPARSYSSASSSSSSTPSKTQAGITNDQAIFLDELYKQELPILTHLISSEKDAEKKFLLKYPNFKNDSKFTDANITKTTVVRWYSDIKKFKLAQQSKPTYKTDVLDSMVIDNDVFQYGVNDFMKEFLFTYPDLDNQYKVPSQDVKQWFEDRKNAMPQSGSGLHKKTKKTKKIKEPKKGIVIVKNKEKLEFGNYLFDKKKLMKHNILSLTHKNNGYKINGYPNIKVSDNLKKFFTKQNVHSNKTKLTENEREFIHSLSNVSDVNLSKSKQKVMGKDPYDEVTDMRDRLTILTGQIDSGNDNIEINNEIGEIITKLVKMNKISRESAGNFMKHYITKV